MREQDHMADERWIDAAVESLRTALAPCSDHRLWNDAAIRAELLAAFDAGKRSARQPAPELLDALAAELHEWRTKRLHGGCVEDLLAEQARCADLAQENAELRAKAVALGNLLAVIHRDGGHHSSRVGDKQSCIDAEQVVLTERAENADLREDRERLDWMEREAVGHFVTWLDALRTIYPPDGPTLRAAIDAARETK